MSNRRLAALAVGFVLAVAASATGQAQKVPFKWSMYTGKDGNQYNSPKWTDDGGGRRTLVSAQGVLTFKETPPVTKVIFKVYRHGPQGGWLTPPAISYPVTPNPTFDNIVGGWILVGVDNNMAAIRFDEGEEIKIVWEVTTTENGVDTVTLVEQIITVQYHAF